MSDRGRAYVEERSPYSGTYYLVHYMMGDLANDTHDWRLYMGDEKMARKCRTSVKTLQRARRQMIEDGFIEVIDGVTAPGRSATYRFLMPTVDNLSTVGPEATVDNDGLNGGHPVPERWTSTDPDLLSTERELERTETGGGAAATADPAEDLCSYLQRRVTEYRGGRTPKVTAAWRREMDLLLRRGPATWERPEPVPASRVRSAIDFVFDRCAEPGRDGFCWADQVRSPDALRRHWDRVYDHGVQQIRRLAASPLLTEAERAAAAGALVPFDAPGALPALNGTAR